MTNADASSSGADEQDSSADSSENSDNTQEDNVKDSVSYESHQRLLRQKKKGDDELVAIRARMTEFEDKDKDAEDAKLKNEKEFKKLYERQKEETEKAVAKVDAIQGSLRNSLKLTAFQDALKGKIDSKYNNLVTLDNININPETHEVDAISVTTEVERFKQEHGILIQKATAPSMPKNYPKGTPGDDDRIPLSAWKKLDVKDMDKWRAHQVDMDR